MALSEDEFEHLLGQLHTAHVLEVQRLREQVRGFQRASSKERMRSEAEEEEIRRNFQEEEEMPDDYPDELTVESSSAISKVWTQGKKRGLKKQKKWRSSSDLQWQGQLRPFLAKCIKRPVVDCTMSFLIFCNALVFAVEAQYRGFEFADAANFRGAPNGQQMWLGVEGVFATLELVFGIVFTIEVCLRLFAEGLGFWREAWNWLDAVVISVWLVENLVEDLPVNSQILRLARIFRLLRLLNLVRRIQEFDPLFLMTTAIRSSMTVLGWSMALLFVCHLLLALVVQQILFGYYFDTESDDPEGQQRVFMYFGTFTRSFLSLFELTLANWAPVCRVLLEEVNEWWVVFCLLHKFTVGFAVVGVINAVLMQETFKVAYLDDTVMVREKMRTMRAHVAKMSELFHEADTSGDGKLDLNEFKRILKKQEVRVWLSAMELDVSHPEELFKMLNTAGDGRLSADELVQGVSRLRGAGRAQEMRKILETSEYMKRMLADMSRTPRLYRNRSEASSNLSPELSGSDKDQLNSVSY
ncbi:Scn11a [Symbiodinium sp. CCMP2592]|nr:Scn11a [Symbiodinium sp. CCMP2592]